MNYYKQGNAANADRIRAAFMAKGFIVTQPDCVLENDKLLIFTHDGAVTSAFAYKFIVDIIKTHPDYKELELPVKPNFKVGDWVVKKDGNTFYGGNYAEQITLIEVDEKGKRIWLSSTTYVHDDDIRLWTIADARDGDVITNGKLIVIFNKLEEPVYRQHIIAYVGLDLCDKLQITEDTWQLGVDKAVPATKEQRDLLFQKMKEAGYEWDEKKKELRKIQPHYDIANFKPFDKVLGRISDINEWRADYFSHLHKNKIFAGIGHSWFQCIPFEGNEVLLGTTDMCPEEYINW